MGKQVVLADFVGFGDVSGSVMEYVSVYPQAYYHAHLALYLLYLPPRTARAQILANRGSGCIRQLSALPSQ
jgi:hypothetical protein